MKQRDSRPGTPAGNKTAKKRAAASKEEEKEAIPASRSSEVNKAAAGDGEAITVCVRARPWRAPPTESELIYDFAANTVTATARHPVCAKRGAATSDAYAFASDNLVQPGGTTLDLFEPSIKPIVEAALDGYNATVFAYGQTSSGKSHTMLGTDAEPGVIPLAVQEIFVRIQSDTERKWHLRGSLMEIYNEGLKDLLAAGDSTAELKIREDKTRMVVDGLIETPVATPADVLTLLERGHATRSTAHTDFNAVSSRSHLLFTLTIESSDNKPTSASSKVVRLSQLSLIDLAGSESATSQGDERRREGKHINKSLLTLSLVINKLSEKGANAAGHINYRDSKLTRLLQTSLGGNARIAVICTISPDLQFASETINTLKFARRAKLVQTKAQHGIVSTGTSELEKAEARVAMAEARIRELEAERERTMEARSVAAQEPDTDMEEKREKLRREVADLETQAAELEERRREAEKAIVTAASVESAMVEARSNLAARRDGGKLRISDIGFRMSPTKLPSSRSFSNKLDAIPSAKVGSLEREAELEAALEQAQLESRQHAEAASRAQQDLRAAQSEHETIISLLNDRIERLQREMHSLSMRLNDKEAALLALSIRCETADRELHASRVEVHRRDVSIAELQGSLDALQERMIEQSDNSEQIVQLQHQLESLAEEKGALQAKLEDSKASEFATAAEKALALRKVEQLSQNKGDGDAAMAALREKLAATERRLHDLSETAETAQQLEMELRRVRQTSETARRDLQAELRERDQHVQTLSKRCNTLDIELASANDEIGRLKLPKLYEPPSRKSSSSAPSASSLLARVHAHQPAQQAPPPDAAVLEVELRQTRAQAATKIERLEEARSELEAENERLRDDLRRFGERVRDQDGYIEQLKSYFPSTPPLVSPPLETPDALVPTRSRHQAVFPRADASPGKPSPFVGHGHPMPLPMHPSTPPGSPTRRRVTVEKELERLHRSPGTVSKTKSALLAPRPDTPSRLWGAGRA